MANTTSKVKQYISPQDFIDPLMKDVAVKLYEQYDKGSVNPAAIINTYSTEEEHNEVASIFSRELNEGLSRQERQKALNDTVIKIKRNSIEDELSRTTDARRMQELIMSQMKLGNINIDI